MCAASYDSETALTVTGRALDLCRELGLPVSVRALGWRGLARCHFGDAGGLDDMRRALVLAKRQGLGRYSGMLYTNLSDELLTFRGTRAAWRTRRKGIEFAGGRGDRMSVIGLQAEQLEDLCWMGRWDAALTRAAEIEGPLDAADQVLDLAIVRSTVARILTARGHASGPKVRAYVEWAGDREFPDLAMAIDALGVLVSVHVAAGEQAQALRLLRRIAAARESIRSCPHYGLRLPAELRTAFELDEPGLARRLAAKTIASRTFDGHALVLLAALESEHEGRPDRAAGRYDEAASRWRAFGAPYEEAHARLGQGRCLAALGRGDDAAAPLRRAARVFRRLGAEPALAQALRLLESRELSRA
jgi:hypothetical protein